MPISAGSPMSAVLPSADRATAHPKNSYGTASLETSSACCDQTAARAGKHPYRPHTIIVIVASDQSRVAVRRQRRRDTLVGVSGGTGAHQFVAFLKELTICGKDGSGCDNACRAQEAPIGSHDVL